MKAKGLNPEEFETYLMTFKYGAPPHGGLGIGLERLTMHLLNCKNVFFVPMRQDDFENKPTSIVADFTKIHDSVLSALEQKQLQPIFTKA